MNTYRLSIDLHYPDTLLIFFCDTEIAWLDARTSFQSRQGKPCEVDISRTRVEGSLQSARALRKLGLTGGESSYFGFAVPLDGDEEEMGHPPVFFNPHTTAARALTYELDELFNEQRAVDWQPRAG